MIVQKGEREFNFMIDIEKAIELEEKDGFNIFDGIISIHTPVKGVTKRNAEQYNSYLTVRT